MLARTHLAFAFLVGMIVYTFFSVQNVVVFFVFLLLGALLPDIDHHGSIINKMFPVTKILGGFFKHRGFFHSIWAVIGLFLLFYWHGYAAEGFYLSIGYFSHLVSDSFTKLGVNFLHPLARVHAKGFIVVGTFHETLFFIVTVVISILFFVY